MGGLRLLVTLGAAARLIVAHALAIAQMPIPAAGALGPRIAIRAPFAMRAFGRDSNAAATAINLVNHSPFGSVIHGPFLIVMLPPPLRGLGVREAAALTGSSL
jgi:hypothetical protein